MPLLMNYKMFSISRRLCRTPLFAMVFALAVICPAAVNAQTAVLNISSPTVVEGDAGTTTVTFNIICDPCDSVHAITDWSTMDGTATVADNDYVAKSGQIDSLGLGTAVETYPVVVTINSDTNFEPDEMFSLKITNASVGCPSLGGLGGCGGSDNGTPPTAAFGTATIFNDDDENEPPTIDVDTVSVTVDEGQTANNTGTFADAQGQGTVTLSASVGTVIKGAGTWSWSLDTTDGPDDSQMVTITATDDQSEMASVDFALTVDNVAPSVSADNASVTVDEGQTANNTGTFSDPGDDTVSLSASVGAVIDSGGGTWSWSFNTSDGPADSQAVTITATDSDGADNSAGFDLVVDNVAPTVGAPTVSAEPSNEGSAVTADAGFSDPAGAADEPFTCSVNYGDGSGATVGAVSGFNCAGSSHTYADNGSYTVEICVTDKDGGSACNDSIHVVDNIDPIITASTNSAEQCGDTSEGAAVDVSADFSDPGFDNLSIAGTLEDFDNSTIDWGDGAIEAATIAETPGSIGTATTGTASGSHTYSSGGIYTIIVTVQDDDGGSDSIPLTALVSGAGLTPGGLLGVVGTNAKDVININRKGANIEVMANFIGAGKMKFPTAAVDQLHVIACDGDDQVHVNHRITVPATLEGGDGRDHIVAGDGVSLIEGGPGDDNLSGGDADDTINGGDGNDKLNGSKGNDSLSGDEGNDNLLGHLGDDDLDGGPDEDKCNGGPGSDTTTNCELEANLSIQPQPVPQDVPVDYRPIQVD